MIRNRYAWTRVGHHRKQLMDGHEETGRKLKKKKAKPSRPRRRDPRPDRTGRRERSACDSSATQTARPNAVAYGLNGVARATSPPRNARRRGRRGGKRLAGNAKHSHLVGAVERGLVRGGRWSVQAFQLVHGTRDLQVGRQREHRLQRVHGGDARVADSCDSAMLVVTGR